MHRLLLAWSFVVCACSGSAPPSALDAAEPAPGTFGAPCTMASIMSTECMSGVCTDTIDKIMHPVCSQQCTYGMNDTCPAGSTGVKMCNMKGYCKP